MGLPYYLAMTAAEILQEAALPEKLAYMACHFSPYSTGLSNLPSGLPAGSLLILNDRIPICGHDPRRITRQLLEAAEKLQCDGIALDLQRPGYAETAALCAHLTGEATCPVAVSEQYAQGLRCPVFLSAPPVNKPLQAHIAPWKDREIWLEAAPDAQLFTVTAQGCQATPLAEPAPAEGLFRDDALFCHYRMETESQAVHFRLWRTLDDLEAQLSKAQALGITRAVGLYQQLADRNEAMTNPSY